VVWEGEGSHSIVQTKEIAEECLTNIQIGQVVAVNLNEGTFNGTVKHMGK